MSINSDTNTQTSASSARDSLEYNEGIIEVIKQTVEEEEEEELKLLRSLSKFEPFLKESGDKGFSIEGLLGIKPNPKPTPTTQTITDKDGLANPMEDMFLTLKAYFKENMSHINMEQRLLFKRISYVHELSNNCQSIMIHAHAQAKLAADKMTEVAALKTQAIKAQQQAIQLFKSLSKLEKHLDPEDRIGVYTQWPVLSALRAQALKSAEHPSIERYISSSSELTTVGTSTSPLFDKMIITSVHDDNIPTPSLALNSLRGLSSRSLSRQLNDT